VTDPRSSGCIGFCGDKTYAQIGAALHQCYDNTHPDLVPWRVEQIHQRWVTIGKKAAAGRL
jgi:hypothetical protein